MFGKRRRKKDKSKILLIKVLHPELCKLDSPVYTFSIEKSDNNSQNIQFLLGQLKSLHSESTFIALQEGSLKYNDELWASEPENILKLHALAQTCGFFAPFILYGDKIQAKKSVEVRIPTLSPTDPNFDKWYKEVYEPRMQKLTQK